MNKIKTKPSNAAYRRGWEAINWGRSKRRKELELARLGMIATIPVAADVQRWFFKKRIKEIDAELEKL